MYAYFFITGSGKSSSMYGMAHEKGIITTAIQYLVDKVPKMTASFVEYYEGKWRDLANKNGLFSQKYMGNYQETEMNSVQDIDVFLERVLHRRKTKQTNQNDTSSRSHAILIVSSGNGGPKMLFVDLAGNEKLEGKDDVKETCSINKSLTQLNTVLSFKARKQLNPPYRDNDFTLFLKPYMVKNKMMIFYHARKENLLKNLMVIKDCCILPKKKN